MIEVCTVGNDVGVDDEARDPERGRFKFASATAVNDHPRPGGVAPAGSCNAHHEDDGRRRRLRGACRFDFGFACGA